MTAAEFARPADFEWPSKLDRAHNAGYDPHPDDMRPPAAHKPEPDGDWSLDPIRDLAAMTGHMCADDDVCGERCNGDCNERMCATYGPEPRACGLTCCDCPCDCQTCVHVQQDMRADLLQRIERDAR